MDDVKNRKKYILIILLLLFLFIILFLSFNYFNRNRLLTGYVGDSNPIQDKDEVKLEPLPEGTSKENIMRLLKIKKKKKLLNNSEI